MHRRMTQRGISHRWMLVGCLAIAATMMAAPQQAMAGKVWGDYLGPTLDFLGVEDTLTSELSDGIQDPNTGDYYIFGKPSRIGNSLLFQPTQFVSISDSSELSDTTAGTLTVDLMAKGGNFLDKLTLSEFGDYQLSGVGTQNASADIFAGMFVAVTEISFDGGTTTQFPTFGVPIFNGSMAFTSTPAGTAQPFDFNNGDDADPSSSNWTGSLLIDITAGLQTFEAFPGFFPYLGAVATKASVSFNNDLATSADTNTTALIQKKFIGGPGVVLEVEGPIVPEPTSLALLALGLASVAFTRRRK